MARLSTTRLLLTLTAVGLSLPTAAFAQLDLTITALEKSSGESCSVMECVNRGFNAQDCSGSASVDLRPAAGTMVTGNMIDVWMTTGTGDCSTTEARNPMSATCQHVGCYDLTDSRFLIPLSDIDGAATTPLCADGSTRAGLNVNLTAFAGAGCMNQDAVDADATDNVSVRVDSVGPVAPTLDSTDLAGDSSVSVGWETGSEANLTYRVLYGGACTGAAGDGGTATVDRDTLTQLGGDTDLMATSRTIDPEEGLGLEIGESVGVYVAAIDAAGNEGELAGPVCVSRIQALGFCDTYMDCESGGCSAGPIRGAGLGSLFLLALVVLRRKR